jgi:DNA-binding beta-propeller fold protein YncE
MKLRAISRLAFALLSLGLCTCAAHAAVLHPHGRTELPGYTGDFDHFAADVRHNRLFLAAEDHGTLEVFDLASGAHLSTLQGVESPHAPLYLPSRDRLVVTDSGPGGTKVFDTATGRRIATIPLPAGADSMGYDQATGSMYVVTGGDNGKLKDSWLVKVNPRTGRKVAEARIESSKVEALAIEEKGMHVYVNVTARGRVDVFDKAMLKPLKSYPLPEGEANAAMAFDEADARLFVVTRKPYRLLVLDAHNGRLLASLPAPQRTNEAIFDRANHRVYLAGDDFLGVVRQDDADHYTALDPVPTAHGAKTAILVPQLARLFVAVSPGEGKTGAALLTFDVEAATQSGTNASAASN